MMDVVRHLMRVVWVARLLPDCFPKRPNLLTNGLQCHKEILFGASFAGGVQRYQP